LSTRPGALPPGRETKSVVLRVAILTWTPVLHQARRGDAVIDFGGA